MADDPKSDDVRLDSAEHLLPTWVRWIVGLVVIAAICSCVLIIVRYIQDPAKNAKPDEIGLSSILIFLAVALAVVAVPLKKLNRWFKKIGPLELAAVVETQAKERVEELSEIREKISHLERQLPPRDLFVLAKNRAERDFEVADDIPVDQGVVRVISEGEDLEKVLLAFLKRNSRTSFSPSKIRVLLEKRDVSGYSTPQIRNALQDLVRRGLVRTKISQKGNTLYKIL